MGKKGKSTNRCDSCATDRAPIRRLELGGGAGIYLCRTHWVNEMKWRRARNRDLKKRGTYSRSTKFPILKFPKSTSRKKRRKK